VNVRRAAAAAFQECVGRLGNFPYGIEIVTTADYFTLALRKNAFLSVGPSIANYEPYGSYFLQRLSTVTIRHWDREVRTLASQCLGILAQRSAFHEVILSDVFPRVLKQCTDASVDVRHGALLTIAEIVAAVRSFPSDLTKDLIMVVPALESQRLFRGRGGEMVRQGACHLVACMAMARIPFPETIQVERAVSSIGAGKAVKVRTTTYYQDILEDCVKQSVEAVQEAAVTAFAIFFAEHSGHVGGTITKMLKMTESGRSPNERRGYSLVLSTLPRSVLLTGTILADVCSALCKATELEEDKEAQDPETRKNAVVALLSVIRKVFDVLPQEILDCALHAFLRAMEDYAVDKRGDVGSLVRMSAVSSGARFIVLLCEHNRLTTEVATSLLQGMFKQMLEKIDRVRGHVGVVLHEIAVELKEKYLTWFISLEPVLRPFLMESNDWSTPSCFDLILSPLLSDVRFRYASLEGLVISVGGLSVHVAKAARTALTSFACESPENQTAICESLIAMLTAREKNDRIVLPCFSAVDLLVTRGLFPISHHAALVDRLSIEIATCTRDIHKQLALVEIVATMCTSKERSARDRCLSFALRMIAVQAYPKVRGKIAQLLYTALLATEEPNDRAMNLLLQVPWEDDAMEAIREARDTLHDIFGVEKLKEDVRKVVVPARGAAGDKIAMAYAGLVREAGY